MKSRKVDIPGEGLDPVERAYIKTLDNLFYDPEKEARTMIIAHIAAIVGNPSCSSN